MSADPNVPLPNGRPRAANGAAPASGVRSGAADPRLAAVSASRALAKIAERPRPAGQYAPPAPPPTNEASRPLPQVLPPQYAAPPQPQGPRRRVTLLGAIIAVVVALVVGGVVYEASKKLSATFSATSQFRVVIQNQGGVSDGTITAANDAASQYAQLAGATPVIDATAKLLKVPPSTLSGKLSGATVAAQNIVQITATAPTAAQANARATAAQTAMVGYLESLNTQQSDKYYASVSDKIRGLNEQIAALNRKISTDKSINVRNEDVNTLQGLYTSKFTATTTLAANAAGGEPAIQPIPGGDNASQTEPKPKEYALIGIVVALLIMLRAAYVIGDRLPF